MNANISSRDIYIKDVPMIKVEVQCLGLPSGYRDKVWQTDYCWSSRLFGYDFNSHSCTGCKRPRWHRENK